MKHQTKIISTGWLTMAIFWAGYALCQVLVAGIGLMLPDMSTELNLTAAQAGTLGMNSYTQKGQSLWTKL